jgi:replicative DNA helicase
LYKIKFKKEKKNRYTNHAILTINIKLYYEIMKIKNSRRNKKELMNKIYLHWQEKEKKLFIVLEMIKACFAC